MNTENETIRNQTNTSGGTAAPAASSHNPWKTGVIATGVALAVLAGAGVTFAAFNSAGTVAPDTATNAETVAAAPAVSVPAVQAAATQATATQSAATQSAPAPAQPAPAAAPAPRENCSVYLAGSGTNNTRVLKDGAIGAVVGAGTGAAGGAIADGGSGAGKGAGIGALVGAVAGAAHGYTQEKQRASEAEQAYRSCLARNG